MTENFWVWFTFGIYTAILLGIAYFSGKIMEKVPVDEYAEEFYTQGRTMGAIIAGFLVSASTASAGTFIGGPGLAYSIGMSWSLVGFSFVPLAISIYGTIGKRVGIISRRFNINSYLDLLSKRYEDHLGVVIVGGISILIFMLGLAASQMMGGARVIEAITGIQYTYALIIFSIVILIYSIFGGIRGVGFATLIQGIVMTIGVLLLFFASLYLLGGFSPAFYELQEISPHLTNIETLDYRFQISMWVIFAFVYIGAPHTVLGTLSFETSKGLNRAMILSIIVIAIWGPLLNIGGLIAQSYVPGLEIPDHAIPMLTMEVLPGPLAGVTIAAVVGAVQSTVGAVLLILSATTVEDIIKRVKPKLYEKKQKRLTQAMTLVLFVLVFIWASFPLDELEWIVIAAFGGLASAFFWPMLLGLYWWRTNKWGAISGITSGLILFILGDQVIPEITFGMNAIMIAWPISLLLTVVISLLTPKPSRRTIELFWGKNQVKDNEDGE